MTLDVYESRRDFRVTAEPSGRQATRGGRAPLFVVQKHAARRLHWDFRLQHGGVLWSWAVPKGPSLDPGDKRLAVHVEDHPVEYADFQGTIPAGEYGAGTVETWDRGTWQPVGDPEAGLRAGELKFILHGNRLRGGFVLVRLKARPKERAENWLLIKERDAEERQGGDAASLERAAAPAPPPLARRDRSAPVTGAKRPAAGAVRGHLPRTQAPQLAALVEAPPEESGWVCEVKFDGYRLLSFIENGQVRLVTRNGNDWTRRLPTIARAVAGVGLDTAVLDGELVALRGDGVSDFGALQDALSEGRDATLFYYLFDLLHVSGWDLRPCRLDDRKRVLQSLADWGDMLRYSDHLHGQTAQMRQQACRMGLEGIICKRADAPYRAGRSPAWVKLKCVGREEFVVLGWMPPAGSRSGIGSLRLGFHDEQGRLHFVGGVGSGFSERELLDLRARLDKLASDPPPHLLYAGEPPERGIRWVRPALVVEVQYAAWTDEGRLRHAIFLAEREDKQPEDVVRADPAPNAERRELGAHAARLTGIVQAARPVSRARKNGAAPQQPRSAVVTRAAKEKTEKVEGVKLTHAERELWPGISKRDLADYWRAVAGHALPEIAHRPLAILRCPEGIDGEHFFQKHSKPGFPPEIRAGEADGAPYLVLDDLSGLIAAAQVSAIELHAWGATEADPLRPDRLVFDLDPGEGVAMPEIVSAAHAVRERLQQHGLAAFCRTTGGKGLHVLAPLTPAADWDTARAWCRAFAEAMAADSPDRFVASVPKARRKGRILVDWLRNGLGSTAVASFCPRARPGAGVATRLTWREVTPKLDPAAFTIATVPQRLQKQRSDPWKGFAESARPLPGNGRR